MGNQVLIISFVVVVIGGIGSIRGALVASLLVGFVDTFGKVLHPADGGHPRLRADGGDPAVAAGRAVPHRLTMNESALSHALPLAAAGALLVVFPFVGGKFYVDLMVTTMILAHLRAVARAAGRTHRAGVVRPRGVLRHRRLRDRAAVAAGRRRRRSSWLLPAVLGDRGAGGARRSARLSLRTRGIYFIMVTLAFAQMAYFVFHDTKFARRQRRPLPERQAGARARPRTRCSISTDR